MPWSAPDTPGPASSQRRTGALVTLSTTFQGVSLLWVSPHESPHLGLASWFSLLGTTLGFSLLTAQLLPLAVDVLSHLYLLLAPQTYIPPNMLPESVPKPTGSLSLQKCLVPGLVGLSV